MSTLADHVSRTLPARADRARVRGRRRDADRVREPVEPAAGAHGVTAEGDRDSHRARREPRPPDRADADRKRRPVVRRRGAWSRARGVRHARAGQPAADEHPDARSPPGRWLDARVHHARRGRHRPDLRRRAGHPTAGDDGRRADADGPQGQRARLDARRRTHMDSRRARGLGDRARLRAADRRRPADPQPAPRARRRSRLSAGARGLDARRSEPASRDAGTAERVLRSDPGRRARDSRRQQRGAGRRASARRRSELEHLRQGAGLRARPLSRRVRARRQRRLSRDARPAPARGPRLHGARQVGAAIASSSSTRRWRARCGPGRIRSAR